MNSIDIDGWEGLELSGGRYRVGPELGEGGMAVVYRAEDRNLKSQVVIKTPRPELLQDKEFAARFRAEVAALVALSHPHIVKVTDVGDFAGAPFAVMQYLAGGSLEDRIETQPSGEKAPMPIERIADWLPQIAAALDFVHSKGFLHRDVKPANVLFDAEGHPYLSDFGIIKAAFGDAAEAEARTKTGRIIGTEFYMSPEAVMGRNLTGAADQYSLAVMVYELLAGRRPFVGPSTAVLVSHTNKRPPPLESLNPRLSQSVCEAIHRGLAKRPSERFASCVDFANAVVQEITGLAKTKSNASTGTHSAKRQTAVQQAPPDFGSATNPSGPAPKSADTARRRKVSIADAPGFESAAPSPPGPGEAVPTAILSTLKAPSGSKKHIIGGGLMIAVVAALAFFAVRNSQKPPTTEPRPTEVALMADIGKNAANAPAARLEGDRSSDTTPAGRTGNKVSTAAGAVESRKDAIDATDSLSTEANKKSTLPPNVEVSKPAPAESPTASVPEPNPEPSPDPAPTTRSPGSSAPNRSKKAKTKSRGSPGGPPARNRSADPPPVAREREPASPQERLRREKEKAEEQLRRAKVANAVQRGAPLPKLGISVEAQELIDIATGKKKLECKPPAIKKRSVQVPAGIHVDPISGLKIAKTKTIQVDDPQSVIRRAAYMKDYQQRLERYFPDRFAQFQSEMTAKASANARFGDEIRADLDKLDQLQTMANASRDKDMAGKLAEGLAQFAVKFGDDSMLDPKFTDPDRARESAKDIEPTSAGAEVAKKIKSLRARAAEYDKMRRKHLDAEKPREADKAAEKARKLRDEADKLEDAQRGTSTKKDE